MINDFYIGVKPQSTNGMDLRNILLEQGIPLEMPAPSTKYLEIKNGKVLSWSALQYPPYDVEYTGDINFDFKYNEYYYKNGKINTKPREVVNGTQRMDVQTMLIMRDIEELQNKLNSTVDDAIAYLDGDMNPEEYAPIRIRRNELRYRIKELQSQIEV